MSSGENLTINDSPIINSPLTSSPLLSAPVSAPLTSSPSNVRYSSGLYHNGVKYEWGKYTPPYDGLCFTANTAGSTVQLTKNGSPTVVSLETSTDGETWTDYTIGNTITLTNIGDKVYMRNKSTTDTLFSLDNISNFYQFVITGSISASGDVTTLINKNGTDTLPDYCFSGLFYNCRYLTTPPQLSATNLGIRCYNTMFYQCFELIALPKMPALSYPSYACAAMFSGCSKIKLSTTQTGEYQTPYRIPSSGTGTNGGKALFNMFINTGGTFTGAPSINTTYYTSNTVV